MKAAAKTLGSMLVLVLAFVGSARGSIITFGLVTEFSGYPAVPPEGTVPPPWLTAVFEDVAGGVNLKLTATNLDGNEFVSEWSFNLDPDLDPAGLLFDEVPGSRIGTFADPVGIGLGVNADKADGDGYFDIKFDFVQPGNQERFGAGESIEYLITGIAGLDASSFNHRSADNNGIPYSASDGRYYTAAHVQGIGEDGEDSGWVTTPEPATLVLLGLGGVGLALTRRRR